MRQDHLNIRKLTESDESKLIQQAKKLAANCADKVDILDELISYISNQGYMIPPLSVFQGIISEALNSETNRLKSITASSISSALETAIENLLETHSDITLSSLKRGPMRLLHAAPLTSQSLQIAVAELGIAVTPIRMLDKDLGIAHRTLSTNLIKQAGFTCDAAPSEAESKSDKRVDFA